MTQSVPDGKIYTRARRLLIVLISSGLEITAQRRVSALMIYDALEESVAPFFKVLPSVTPAAKLECKYVDWHISEQFMQGDINTAG